MSDEERHIKRDVRTPSTLQAWCGAAIEEFEWAFCSADHAATHLLQSKIPASPAVCPMCVDAVCAALSRNRTEAPPEQLTFDQCRARGDLEAFRK